MYKRIKKYLFSPYLIIFSFAFVIYYPSFFLKFSLVDDGYTIQISKEIFKNLHNISQLSQILFEPQYGRVRPMYWIIQSIISLFLQYSPTLLHIGRFLILILTSFFLIKVMKKLSISKLSIYIYTFVFIFTYQNFVNYYRLGPTEVYLVLGFLLTLNIILHPKPNKLSHIYIITISIFTSFIKEVYFLLFPAFIVLYLVFKKDKIINKKQIIILSASLIFSGILIFIVKHNYPTITNIYSDNYQIDISQIIKTAKNYIRQIIFFQSPFIYIFFYIFFKNTHNAIKTKSVDIHYKKIIVFLFFALSQLIVLLPWRFSLGRYLLMVNVSLLFVFALSTDELMEQIYKLKISNKKVVNAVVLAIVYPLFLTRNMIPMASYQNWQKTDASISNSSLNSLAEWMSRTKTKKVYVNFLQGDSNIEMFEEMKIHLENFYGQKGTQIIYLTDNNLCTKVKRLVFDRKSVRLIGKDVLEKSSNLTLLDFGEGTYKELNYPQVKTNFFKGNKNDIWYLNYKFDWSVFRQKEKTCLQKK